MITIPTIEVLCTHLAAAMAAPTACTARNADHTERAAL